MPLIKSLILLLLAMGLCLAGSATDRAEWLTQRGNNSLDGHTGAKGALVAPKVVWSQFVGVFDAFVVAAPGDGPAAVPLPDNDKTSLSGDASDGRWGLSAPPGNFEGRGQPVPGNTSVVCADVLPDVPGLEKVEFESGFSKPTVNGKWQPCVGRCFAWKDGKWDKVWETDPLDMLFIALPLAGDFDGDGRIEIAFLPWYELVLLDAQTGRIKDRCKFTEGRSYGFFGAYDLDGDGRGEFVVAADFCKHIDVLGFRDGRLAVLWSKPIEPDISNPQKILRVNPDPVADMDGDGKLEVMENLWDGTTDARWHLLVHDGMTGAVKADLAVTYMQGLCDLDGDKTAELLILATSGAGVPQFGPSRVCRIKDGTAATLWEQTDAGWQTWDPPLKPNINSGATLAQQTALCRRIDGTTWAALRSTDSDGKVTVSLVSWEDKGFEKVLSATAPALQAIAIAPQGQLLLKSAVPPGHAGEITLTGGRGTYLGSQRRGLNPSTPIVVNGPDNTPRILLQGNNEKLLAFQPTGDVSAPLSPVWEIDGHAQGDNWPNTYGPVAADLSGDGHRQVLYATAAPSGCGRLLAADLDAHEVWHHDFPEIPGTAPVWNTGGIIFWQAGHFTDAVTRDVLVTVRRSMMHSEETLLLSGKDGTQLWRRNRQISQRGVGGIAFAVADFDGDGLDDAASFHPSIFYILKGTTGADIVARDATWEKVPAKPVYWGKPVAGHFLKADGPADVFMAGTAMTGLVRADGTLVWHDALDKSAKTFAFGDFDGDGKTEALGAEYEDGLRCYDAATGAVKWRMANPMTLPLAGAASADLDGDGKDEAVFTGGTSVGCFGDTNGQGTLKWRVDLPCTIGPSVLADTDGTGTLSLLVMGVDGCLYCIR